MIREFEKRILSSLILIPLSFFFIIKGSFLFTFFLKICFLLTSLEWFALSKNKKYNLIGHVFLIFSFYSAYSLRNDFDDKSLFLFLITIITCISTDVGGYIFGKIFKGPKLTKISPKKTYSGMIGSYFLSIIIIILLINYSYYFLNEVYKFTSELLIMVLLLSTISQIGDIFISYFKRLSKIKDTGQIIPGHGGILDRIDGMIFAFPFSYIIISLDFFK